MLIIFQKYIISKEKQGAVVMAICHFFLGSEFSIHNSEIKSVLVLNIDIDGNIEVQFRGNIDKISMFMDISVKVRKS